MITKDDLNRMSVSITDYGNGWYDTELYYRGKLVATLKAGGETVIDEDNLKRLEIEKRIDKQLREEIPIDLLTEDQREEAKKIAKTGCGLYAVKYINDRIDEGLKVAKTYYDLYIDERNNHN